MEILLLGNFSTPHGIAVMDMVDDRGTLRCGIQIYSYVMCTVAIAWSAFCRSSLDFRPNPFAYKSYQLPIRIRLWCTNTMKASGRLYRYRWPCHNHLSPSRTGYSSYMQVQSRYPVKHRPIKEAARCRLPLLAPCIGLSIWYFCTCLSNESVSWICRPQSSPQSRHSDDHPDSNQLTRRFGKTPLPCTVIRLLPNCGTIQKWTI